MGDFTVILPFNHTNGTTADANEVMANYSALRDGHNNSLHGTTGHLHTGANGDGPKLGPSSITLNANYDWLGIHTFLCGNLRVKGAGTGTVGFCYENSAAIRTHTIPASSGNDIFATLLASQSLSNKTLVSPVIQGGNVTADVTVDVGKKIDGIDVGTHVHPTSSFDKISITEQTYALTADATGSFTLVIAGTGSETAFQFPAIFYGFDTTTGGGINFNNNDRWQVTRGGAAFAAGNWTFTWNYDHKIAVGDEITLKYAGVGMLQGNQNTGAPI